MHQVVVQSAVDGGRVVYASQLIQLHRIQLYECARTMNYSALGNCELNSNINNNLKRFAK